MNRGAPIPHGAKVNPAGASLNFHQLPQKLKDQNSSHSLATLKRSLVTKDSFDCSRSEKYEGEKYIKLKQGIAPFYPLIISLRINPAWLKFSG